MTMKNKNAKTVSQEQLDSKAKKLIEEIKKKDEADDKACMDKINTALAEFKRKLDPQIMIGSQGVQAARFVLIKIKN